MSMSLGGGEGGQDDGDKDGGSQSEDITVMSILEAWVTVERMI
jgi:hypothetical protein